MLLLLLLLLVYRRIHFCLWVWGSKPAPAVCRAACSLALTLAKGTRSTRIPIPVYIHQRRNSREQRQQYVLQQIKKPRLSNKKRVDREETP